jgi:hypothetical protein
MSINLDSVTTDGSTRSLVERFLDKKLLERADWTTPLANSTFGDVRGIQMNDGQYGQYTRKTGGRRPQHMLTPSGAGSDPASGITLGTDKVLIPTEWVQDFAAISTVGQKTSWLDLTTWAEDDMPRDLLRRQHELVQNAMLVGRFQPGQYDSSGTATTQFDQTAQATVTLYGISFTFQKCPIYYAKGKTNQTDLVAGDTLDWATMRNLWIRLDMAHAPKIKGNYACVLSSAQWLDLLTDTDGGRLTAAMAGGLKSAIKGLESNAIFEYAGWFFVLQDNPFTEVSGSENKRANWGPIHAAHCFGANCFGYVSLGDRQMRPKFKVQDVTKTGYEKTIGYLMPWQVGVENPNWGFSIKSIVSQDKPNNYDPADPTKMLDGFGV